MSLILGKSRVLKPKNVKEIRYVGHPEKKATELAIKIAKEFGQISKKMKPKKMFFR
jgi:hypothetical protein